MRFADPIFLLFLLVLPILLWRWLRWQGASAPILFSDISRVKKVFGIGESRRPRIYFARHLLFLTRLAAVALFILAMARPQAELYSSEVYTEGVDIILTVDVSGSMNLIDPEVHDQRTRMEVTREAIEKFIAGRQYDRIGLVVFATDAYLQCPLTADYGIIQNFIKDIHIGMIPETSTAIGNALASSINRLRDSEAESKVIILLTDGANNAGQIDPLTAAQLAQALGIKIYTIGIGGRGAPYVMIETLFGRQLRPYPDAERIDEENLQAIAEIANGRFYHAANVEGFQADRKSVV